MPRHHLIISGTGRAGTTFLVQLFTRLGFDTGFADAVTGIYPNCHAGMERDIRDSNAPYIVKSPWLCDYLGEVLDGGEIVIDHAIVPMRDLYAAAESRRDVVRRSDPTAVGAVPDAIPGGLWHTQQPAKQEAVLAEQLHKLLVALARHGIPTTLLYFPRFALEPAHLYERLRFMLAETPYDVFEGAFQEISQPQLIHRFSRATPLGS